MSTISVRSKSNTIDQLNLVSNVIQNFQLRGISKELKTQTSSLKSIDQSVGRMTTALDGMNQRLAGLTDLQQKQLLIQERQQTLLEKQEMERQEQKEIKKALFSLTSEIRAIEQTADSALARYVQLTQVQAFARSDLVTFIEKLEQIADKQYAADAIDQLNAAVLRAFDQMTEEDRADWATIARLNTELTAVSDEERAILAKINVETARLTHDQAIASSQELVNAMAAQEWFIVRYSGLMCGGLFGIVISGVAAEVVAMQALGALGVLAFLPVFVFRTVRRQVRVLKMRSGMKTALKAEVQSIVAGHEHSVAELKAKLQALVEQAEAVLHRHGLREFT